MATTVEQARIKEQEQMLVSERDCEIFFNEIIKAKSPNKALIQAADKYKSHFSNEKTHRVFIKEA